MTDINLDDTAMTKREALQRANERLMSVVEYCLNLSLEPDEMDKESIRIAYAMVKLALK